MPIDEFHDVERHAVDRLVGAQPGDRGHGDVGRLQPRNNSVFATHVMRARENMAEWRSAQHEAGAVTPGHGHGEVGVAAGDRIVRERADGAVDVLFEPGRHRSNVNAWNRALDGVRRSVGAGFAGRVGVGHDVAESSQA